MVRSVFLLMLIAMMGLQTKAQLIYSDTLTYNEVDKILDDYYAQGKFDSAVVLLEYAKDRYPEEITESSWNLIMSYGMTQQHEKMLEEIQWGLNQDYWYGIDASWSLFDSVRDNKRFQELLAENKLRKQQAQEKARRQKLIQEPDGFHPDSTYPLFIALHGWGQDIEEFKKQWHAELLDKEFILVYLQSSQVATMDGYGWQDSRKGYDEVIAAYHELDEKYNLDTNRTIIGGFSHGGKLAIYATLEDSIPVQGFWALCPMMPENFTEEKVVAADEAGKRGVLVTGIKDNMLRQQAGMIGTFRRIGFVYRYIVKKTIGHEFPEDLPELLTKKTPFLY